MERRRGEIRGAPNWFWEGSGIAGKGINRGIREGKAEAEIYRRPGGDVLPRGIFWFHRARLRLPLPLPLRERRGDDGEWASAVSASPPSLKSSLGVSQRKGRERWSTAGVLDAGADPFFL